MRKTVVYDYMPDNCVFEPARASRQQRFGFEILNKCHESSPYASLPLVMLAIIQNAETDTRRWQRQRARKIITARLSIQKRKP